jgi:hypothetical protein
MNSLAVAVLTTTAVGAIPALPSQSAADTHWAFRRVEKPEVPAMDDPWVRSPIDAFILRTLHEARLSPSPEADRRTLLRRATFDLTGLPPTFAELKSFEADDAPDAFERVVERLLASHTYGQHWARHWLDVARYADTKGYVFTANPFYPYAYTYRDYVVDALNDDLPYAQFVIEQLAADLVDEPRNDRTLAALGFLTVGRRFSNNVHDILDDRIDVITRGFLGLTVACARCHDHKYDPIPTADYYSLYGVLASCEEPDDLPYVGDPTRHPGYERFKAALDRKREAAEDYLSLQHALLSAELRNRIGEYLQVVAQRMAGNPVEKTPDGLKPRFLDRWQQFLEEPIRAKDPAFSVWAALAKLPQDQFAQAAQEKLTSVIERACRDEDATVNLLVASALLCEKPQSLADASAAIGRLFSTADSLWVSMGNPILSAIPLPPEALDRLHEALALQPGQQESPDDLRLRTLEHALADLRTLRDFLYAPDAPIALSRNEVRRNLEVREKQKLERLFREVEEFEAESPDAPPRAMVVRDKSNPVEPHIFERGNPNRQGKQVPRQFLRALAGEDRQPFQKGSGRLQLAQAIASPSNPLTARVIVNRVWQHHFGEGLVRTPSNFGTNGEPPSHPKLLDWLAAEFIEHGWSLKWLHVEIMRSSAYRQRSEVRGPKSDAGKESVVSRPLSLEKSDSTTDHGPRTNLQSAICNLQSEIDPENRLLWRQKRRRLDFEPLRDTLLAWSGRLDTTLGGQPFRFGENPSTPRRTIYGLIDRQELFEPLRYFDVASPDASASERPRTTVPQQALFLLNSPFVAEQARALVVRLAHDGVIVPADKVVRLYQTVLLREPSAVELASAEAFLADEEVENTPESDPQLTRLEQLAQTLMVCNEAVFVD